MYIVNGQHIQVPEPLTKDIEFACFQPYNILIGKFLGREIYPSASRAFGVDGIADTLKQMPARVTEFSVAPQIDADSGLPYHEWMIEFDQQPDDIEAFTALLNDHVGERNVNYAEFCEAGVLSTLRVRPVRKGGFAEYMESIGKLTAQSKVPRLLNDRGVADQMTPYLL